MTEHLSDKEIQVYKATLIGKKSAIEIEIQNLNDLLRSTQTTAPDPIDAAVIVEQRNGILAQIEQKHTSLKEVEHALVNFSEFGYCLVCGEEINLKRLMFNPATTECIDCKTLSEKRKNDYR